MARLKKITINGCRSILNAELTFPDQGTFILIGENNAGKSNIVRAIDLLLGELWPSSHVPEDNEFYQRDVNHPVQIEAEFSQPMGRYDQIRWRYDSSADPEVEFGGINEWGQVRFIKSDERTELVAITIGADRRSAATDEFSIDDSTQGSFSEWFAGVFPRARSSDRDILA